MENLTAVDGGAALIILVSSILAFSRGLVREMMAILGWIGAAIAAYYFAPGVQPLVKELPVVGEFLADSCELSVVAAFAGVFVVGLIVAALFTPLFSGAVQRSALGGIDQALGFLFGAARGILLIAVGFIVYDRVLSDQAIPMIDESRTAMVFANFQSEIDENIPTDAPGWIVERYNELTNVCATGAAPLVPAPEAAPATTPEAPPEGEPAAPATNG
jgi:membrane protein required for colicin V production